MEPGIIFFGLFFLLLFIGVPIAVSVGITALVFLWGYNLGIQVMSTNFFANIAKFPLLAIPFFILAGFLMDRVGLSRRLVNLLHLLVGPIPGGLGIVAVLGCVLFGAISGTGPADTAAIGAVMIPAMVKRGYDIGFSSALVASAATTDVLIPPSVAFVVYGVITETSIGGLFAAGVVPGLIMGAALILPVYLISKKHGWGGDRWGTREEIWQALKEAFWGLMAPIIILGGIYGGIFTPTEAAVVAVFYGFFVGAFIYRNLSLQMLYEVLRDSALSTAVVMIVVAFAGLFAWTGSTMGIMDRAAKALLGLTENPVFLLLLLNGLLLIAGMLLDAISIYYVFLPILIPVIRHFGWDPIWFGVMMTVNLAIGTVTPPVALNLYVAANLASISMEKISRAAIPFILALIVSLMFVTYIPSLSLWLPKVFGLR
ncbi:MAG TPA: TRAP transporter large permease [Thermodesulfobacteriota bacterium]|nr:TRAP transporter large permease [Thermodesulfobacteriota bacterium]